MYYQQLPLYLKLVNLLKIFYPLVHELPKEYKFSLGQDIINRNWELLDLFILSQTAPSGPTKLETIKKLNREFDLFKLRVRFLSELELISLGQSTVLAADIVEIGNMIGSWLARA